MDENQVNAQEKEIDLRVIFSIIKRNLIMIIIFILVFGAGFYAYSRFFIPKKYSASATLIVNNKDSDRNAVNYTEITAAQNLADVYAIIIKSETVLQQVIDDLNLDMTYSELKNTISVDPVNNTQVIQVSMTHTDADYAKEVIADLVEVAPPIIADKVDAGSVKVIDEAKISNEGNPVSPNSKRNALIGALVGLVLALVIVFLKEFLNNTFKTEDDIINSLNVPLIGIIPRVEEKEFNADE